MTEDQQAIYDIVKTLEDAWNAKDSVAFAAPFLEDATFIHIFGGQLDGRPAVEASHRSIFDTIYKGSQATFSVRSVRFVRPDAAIAFTNAHVKVAEGSPGGDVKTRPTMFVVKDQGTWQIVAFQNTKISEIPAAAGVAKGLAT